MCSVIGSFRLIGSFVKMLVWFGATADLLSFPSTLGAHVFVVFLFLVVALNLMKTNLLPNSGFQSQTSDVFFLCLIAA